MGGCNLAYRKQTSAFKHHSVNKNYVIINKPFNWCYVNKVTPEIEKFRDFLHCFHTTDVQVICLGSEGWKRAVQLSLKWQNPNSELTVRE